MTEENTNENEVAGPDELTLLKERAAIMGITHHPSIGVEKLKIKINDALAAGKTEPNVKAPINEPLPVHERKRPKLSEADIKRMYHSRLRKEANRLVRIRLTCMNPNKKNWPGEVFTISNSVIGTVKKFVPFNAEEGYHVPQVIYDHLKNRKYQQFSTVKYPNGLQKKVGKLVKEFAIEKLDPLTEAQLKDLAERQAMNHSID